MGVLGLWTLLEPAGKPLPLETLENKILAIDVSIWLNQAVKGVRDQEGGTVANAHLLSLFHRICKLLFYKIRPIFVFDGKAPQLKRDTLRKRLNARSNMAKKNDALRAKILDNFIKRNAVASQLQRQTFALNKTLNGGQEGLARMIQKRAGKLDTGIDQKDLFELPPIPSQGFGLGTSSQESSSDEEDDWKTAALAQLDVSDIHSLDLSSKHFQSLPTEIQFELLADIKERRKQNSWNKMSEMPRDANEFAGFQIERLVKRNQVQKKLCEVGRQLGQEAAEGLDASLFVGDKQGLRKNLKQELKRVASSTDGAHIMYVSGLNNSENDSANDEPDSHIEHVPKVAKMKSSDKGNVSKPPYGANRLDENTIESQPSYSDMSSSDDSIDFLEPSSQEKKSNRTGGANLIATLDDEVDQNSTSTVIQSRRSTNQSNICSSDDSRTVLPMEIHIPVSQVEYMSSSDESEDDMFSDVFTNPNDVTTLDQILSNAKTANESTSVEKVTTTGIDSMDNQILPTGNMEIMTPRSAKYKSILESLKDMSEGNKVHDVYAQITKNSKSNPKRTSYDGVRDDEKNIGIEIANSMKHSDQIWLKKASKWVEDKVVKPLETKVDTNKSNHPKSNQNKSNNQKSNLKDSLLDWEQKQLVEEMKQNERENRLLKIKNLSSVSKDNTKLHSSTSISEKPDVQDANIFRSLGVSAFEKSEMEHQVILAEGWETTIVNESDNETSNKHVNEITHDGANRESINSESVVYGDSAEGFVTTKKYKVVELAKEDGNSNSNANTNVEALTIEKNIYDKLYSQEDEANSNKEDALTETELFALQQKLAEEQQSMVAEQKKVERFAATLTDQMYQECQELLQLFGIPWVVSPGEAEAQCAFLDEYGLCNGIITDDSDIWVFGGKNVYKNFFERDKYCESFCLNELTKHFGLTREKMIQIAMLTGSDYTEGIHDIGPVTSMEVLAEFPGEGIDPLLNFAKWWREINGTCKIEGKFIKVSKTREKLKRFQLPSEFPNPDVFDAYMKPNVDTSKEKFSWAVPNFIAARDYASDKFGWTKYKTDQILKPVIRKMTATGQNAEFQSRIDNYFQSERMTLPKKGSKLESSKRVKEAIERVINKESNDETKPCIETTQKVPKAKTIKKGMVKNISKQIANEHLSNALESQDQTTLQSVHSKLISDLESDEKTKKALAKQKAIEIYKKSQSHKSKERKTVAAKHNSKSSKSTKKSDTRKVLSKHNLSESDDDD